MNVGMKYTLNFVVTEEITAKVVGSGELEVLATPMMIAYMEKASSLLVKPYLAEEETTVGTLVNVSHVMASLVGEKIEVVSELTLVDRKRLVFSVKAMSEAGLIGEGTHERFIINSEKFMNKLKNR